MSEHNKEFIIDFIAVNDCSFYAKVPVFRISQQWQPTAHLDLDVKTRVLDNNQFEVDLAIDVKVRLDDADIFAVHVVQTGAFTIKGYDADAIEQLTESFCPSVLYPYARENVARLVAHAGFPQLHLSPVDFEGRYHAQKNSAQ